MKLFDGYETIVKENEPLSKHTWFRIGGPAKYFIEPTSFDELCQVVKRCRENEIPIYVLGGGANLLVADSGVKGAVIRLAGEDFQQMKLDERSLTVGAGADMGKVVLRCVREGRTGLEGLTGVPGTVGGCVRMNAGGAFGDIGSTIESVTVMDEDGSTFQRFRPDLAFAYRSSNITAKFILSATFNMADDDPHRILKEVKQIWMHKKNSQPLGARNAGCVFKNPRGMSAGALIDKAGMKGKRVGGAYVSEKHANFILAEKGCTAFDVLRLIDMIRDAVAREFNVNLEKEIEVW
jgi:UDP-N-acetylmuramate dehydrogenase